MWEQRVSGWRVDWRPGEEQILRHSAALRSLAGARLIGAWTVLMKNGEWFADLPVVLQFDGGQQLEICWQRHDDLSITWGTIDLAVTPRGWLKGLSWQPWAHPALQRNRGERVVEVAAVQMVSTVVDHPPGGSRQEHVWSGLWLATSGPGLHVFNAMDENGLSTDLGSDRRLPIA